MDPAPAAEAQSTPKVAFDSNKAWEHLRKQVSIGPRPSGTPAIVETRRYIIEQLKAAGIESREQMFIGMTPLGEVSMVNVIATIPGKRKERIAIASHFDTKLYREFKFVGANDGASSTAARPFTVSTRASASSRVCASRPTISNSCSAISCSRMRRASASGHRSPSCD
jgi:hypothetical protein